MSESGTINHSRIASWGSLLLIVLILGGCTTSNSHFGLNADPYVRIITRPDTKNLWAGSVGIFNFNLCNSRLPDKLGGELAQFTYRHLLRHQFATLVELAGRHASSIEEAVDLATQKGYQLILLGDLADFFYGGQIANSRVSMSLKVIDVRTGITIWYISGRIEAPYEESADYLFFVKEGKDAPSPRLLSAVVLEKLLDVLIGG
ncbi:MAG: hypothetical protein SV775_10805 [Thermodesulfobacteriota bacterium]|nr:hypothetical protein [Thermodesulfobacteriota bacterium]